MDGVPTPQFMEVLVNIIIWVLIIAVIAAIIATCVKIVPQESAYVIERFGKVTVIGVYLIAGKGCTFFFRLFDVDFGRSKNAVVNISRALPPAYKTAPCMGFAANELSVKDTAFYRQSRTAVACSDKTAVCTVTVC